jgi:predicted RecB family nuclease
VIRWPGVIKPSGSERKRPQLLPGPVRRDERPREQHTKAPRVIISSSLFEAYLECPTKCWLRSRGEPNTGNAYAEWARLQNETHFENGLKQLLETFPESDRAMGPPIFDHAEEATWRLAIDVRLQTDGLESRPHAVERMAPVGRGRSVQFIPYRFQFANKLAKNDKLSLAFDALVLSRTVGREVSIGKIVHGNGHSMLKVKLPSIDGELQKRIKGITVLLAGNLPPELVLNRHCGQCEFQGRCRKQALEKDDLSLLSGMSEKERKKLHGKGIFTVTQLSYTFRPRRRRRTRHKQEKFHHSLRALAIREKKIHVVDLPDLQLDGTPVYLDVEGLPDREFYYLIGIRVGTGNYASQHSLWANDWDGEKRIWNEFLNVLSAIPNPRLVHFGSYETVFLRRMRDRHGGPHEGTTAATAIENAVNLLSFVFAHIYFPTFSNGLKEIAGYLGFRRLIALSGLEAIVWRHHWEASKDTSEKQVLLDYNREDCEALELVANRMMELHREASANGQSSRDDVILASNIKRESPFPFRFGRNAFAFPELEAINKAAYWHYQRERVYVKSQANYTRKRERQSNPRSALIPNTTIECLRASRCPVCKSKLIYRHGKRSKIEVDLRFMRHGIKRWITRYVGHRYRCQSCRTTFNPPDRRWPTGKYGRALAAYTVYQNIELGLPQSRVASSVRQLFGLHLSRNTANQFKAATAQSYTRIYDGLLKRLCSGRLLHVDETSASVIGKDSYVWVLTSMKEVAYFYTPTREGSIIQSLLKDFSGVLVTDFYSAYEAIECPQQKCLIHFIRDLNDELLKHPYDERLKQLVGDFASLLKPIIETVDRRGLKKRFLGKYRIPVDRFYKHLSDRCTSEAATKLVERLHKNRNKMFTFLDFDDVPWNNNNAEHAIKAFASLRRVIEGKSTEKGLRDFLILLSICETCKYKSIDFLNFLRSGSNDIDDFANSR